MVNRFGLNGWILECFGFFVGKIYVIIGVSGGVGFEVI